MLMFVSNFYPEKSMQHYQNTATSERKDNSISQKERGEIPSFM